MIPGTARTNFFCRASHPPRGEVAVASRPAKKKQSSGVRGPANLCRRRRPAGQASHPSARAGAQPSCGSHYLAERDGRRSSENLKRKRRGKGRTGRAALTAALPAALRVRAWLLQPRCGPHGAAGRRAAWRRRGPVATLPATQLVPLLDAGAVLQRPCAAGRRAAPRRRTAHRRGASHGARPALGCQSRAAAPRCAPSPAHSHAAGRTARPAPGCQSRAAAPHRCWTSCCPALAYCPQS